jgi:hypothetical protein
LPHSYPPSYIFFFLFRLSSVDTWPQRISVHICIPTYDLGK